MSQQRKSKQRKKKGKGPAKAKPLQWSLGEVKDQEKKCWQELPDDFEVPKVPEGQLNPFLQDEKSKKWYKLNPVTETLLLIAQDVGLNRITDQNAGEWMVRIDIIQSMYERGLMQLYAPRPFWDKAQAVLKAAKDAGDPEDPELSEAYVALAKEMEELTEYEIKDKHLTYAHIRDHAGFYISVPNVAWIPWCERIRSTGFKNKIEFLKKRYEDSLKEK